MVFSLRSKFIIFIASAIILFEFLFLYFSVDLYNKDKSSFIFESSLNYSNSLSKVLGQHIDELRLISNYDLQKNDTLKLPSSLSIIDMEIIEEKNLKSKFDLDPKSKLINEDSRFWEFVKNSHEDVKIENTNGILILTYFKHDPSRGLIAISSDITSTVQSLKSSKIFSLFLLNSNNELITYLTPDGSVPPPLFFKELSKLNKTEGAFESTLLKKEYIVSYSKSPSLLVSVLSTVPKSLAFEASRTLIQQTLGLGLIFMGASIIGVLLFARMVTKPIIDLTETARKISQGDYDQVLKKRSNDEIGVLTLAFNKMVEDIRSFIISMREKDRIENEILVAKNVQLSFLPNNYFSNDQVELASFYSSASECGGDWWGYQVKDDITYLFMSDATGHGLPASLLTASVSSCCEALIYEMKNSNRIINPSEVLKMINYVICSSSSEMMMTMLVVMINHTTQELVISNASHEFPIKIGSDGEIKILTPTPGKRLGEEISSLYEDQKFPYNEGDKLFLYTDGLIENRSTEEKPFGERKLLRLIKKKDFSVTEFRDLIQQNYLSHVQQKAPDDDVTYLFASLR